MPLRAERVARELQAVGLGHDSNQVPRAPLDVLVDLGAQILSGFEEPQQPGHAGGVLIDLGHETPFLPAARGKLQPGTDEIRAAPAADQPLLIHRVALPEAVELRRTQQPPRRFEALAPDRVHA